MLKHSKAVFDPDLHEYWLGEKQLSGLTRMISKHLFPDKYKAVDSEVLKKAAEKGSLIHSEIEHFLETGDIGFTAECFAFADWWLGTGEAVLGAEFLVNNDNFATCIDLVSEKDGEIILSNHKTTYALDHDYSSWQGSIEAYLFERQNPELKVGTLRIIWLRDSKIELVEVPRKTDKEIEALLQAELDGKMYQPKELVSANMLAKVVELESLLKEIDTQKKQAEAQAKALREELMTAMENQGVKSFENEQLKITYILPSTRETIDSKKLKAEYPEIAEKVTKTCNTKASIRITLRD